MTGPVRLAVIAIVFLLRPEGVSAQLPVAPPPHPALQEVVKEYLRLELPLPPKDATLVRIHLWRRQEDGSPGDRFCVLGFRLPASRPGADPRYWIGSGSDGPYWIDPHDIEVCTPGAAAESGTELLGSEALRLAIFCKVRGWNELAAALYARTWREWEGYDEAPALLWNLSADAFLMWERRLREPASDRREILVRLKKLVAEEPELRDEKRLGLNATALMKHLEATIEHRRKGPRGSVEDLIDDLVDYRPDSWTGAASGAAYRKLVEAGFDAVPALIDHLDDRRLTRSDPHLIFTSTATVVRQEVDVGYLCNQILSGLAAGELQHPSSSRVTKAAANEWFEQAKKIGEEKWLLDHTDSHANVQTLGAKHPGRLVEAYRAALKKPIADRRVNFASAIAASTLSKERKAALLEEAAGHEHISFQLEAIAHLDGAAFRKRLLATLKQIESRQRNEANYLWEPSGDIGTLAELVAQSRDSACWQTLSDIAKRLPLQLRMELIDAVGWQEEPDAPDPARTERIRFLMRFLDDRTKEKIEIRDVAATQLAGLFRMPVVRHAFLTAVMQNPDAGPLARAIRRAAVMNKAQDELKR